MKVLILLAKGFETMEFSVFIDIFGWARHELNLDIHTKTAGFTPVVESTFGVPVTVDRLLEDINAEDYAALAIPGGFEEFGFYEEAYAEPFLEVIRGFHAAGKPIATVCVAALPLAKSGVLQGRRGTTYHLRGGDRQERLRKMGVLVQNEPVVTDGNLITSWCPQTAPEVAFRLLEMLSSQEQAEKVKYRMGYSDTDTL